MKDDTLKVFGPVILADDDFDDDFFDDEDAIEYKEDKEDKED